MPDIIVLGAGPCGLAAATLLARDGHAVTVLERDAAAAPESTEVACEGWRRDGVRHFRQAHYMHPAFRVVLDAELPDVRDDLVSAGALRFDLLSLMPPTITDRRPREGDGDLVSLTARRPVLERAFAVAAERQDGLGVRRGTPVAGLTIAGDREVPHVTGVRLENGEALRADLVVDAMGRRSPLPGWLAATGAAPVSEAGADSGYAYYTRFFGGAGDMPAVRAPLNTPIGSISILTLPADNGAWSVTIYAASGDQPLKRLRFADVWDAVLRACPLQAQWAGGEPSGGVVVMAGISDRRRRLVTDGRPVATGVALLGDAWACTNPSNGRGVSLGLMHSRMLRDAVRAHGLADQDALVRAWDETTERELGPWYDLTVAEDRARLHGIEAARANQSPPPPSGPLVGLLPWLKSDADAFRATVEIRSCIRLPDAAIAARPGLAERIAGRPPGGPGERRPVPGPSREELLELVAEPIPA